MSRHLLMVVVLAALLAASACQPRPPIRVDRHEPESVLRAYFDAWSRSDWIREASFMADKYKGMTPEPLSSLSIVSLKPLPGGSSERRLYRVVFDVTVAGNGVSMQNGRRDWSYELTWDKARDSWLVTNYGAG